jgi:hypothetical protein
LRFFSVGFKLEVEVEVTAEAAVEVGLTRFRGAVESSDSS